jgi:hypothetical protein
MAIIVYERAPPVPLQWSGVSCPAGRAPTSFQPVEAGAGLQDQRLELGVRV